MMLEELERRNYSAGTTRRYLRFVERFAQHFHKSPDKLGPDHLRSYQAYLLTELKLCPGSVENHVAALRFFFVRTLHRHEFREYLPYPKTRKKLPNILSQEEVARLINASSSLFQRTLLMVLYGTGMRRAELARVKIAHIDSQRMIIHVVDGKGHKDRDLPLSPTLLENLRVYWRRLKPRTYLVPVATASRSRAAHQRQDCMGGGHRSSEEVWSSQGRFAAPGSPCMGHASAGSRY
jgi:integrase/recombinase XerD